MKDSIILYPNLGRGHLISMVELGKLILTHNPSFSITILILTPPNQHNTPSSTTTHGNDSNAKYIAAISTTVPSITFHHIPPPASFTASFPPHLLALELSRHSVENARNVLQSLSKTSNVKAVIVDFLNYKGHQITDNLDIPTLFYFTSGAASLGIMLQFPTIHQNASKPLKDLHASLQIPGLPRFSTDDLPEEVKDPACESYHIFLDTAKTMSESIGIIVNTFEAIEKKTVRALNYKSFLPDRTTPPVFCIGPVISAQYGENEDTSGCLNWLDSQPSQSVVLLSFGSMGTFSRKQLKETAIGLEKSEQRFLWVVRSKSDGGDSELSLDELLPEGFMERIKEKGLVVKNWAPQAAILSHDSVGGFVTHCGWNSVLEAICEGVPMVAWPLYAEQKMNEVSLVQEMKVALALNMNSDGLVSATELGDRVKELMESDKGKEIRQRIFKMKISAVEAKAEGGSSRVALNKLFQLWK